MTAILFYANYDNNYMSIIRSHLICQATNIAYANTCVANLNQNLWSETDVVNNRSNFTIQMAAILFMNAPVHECASVLHNTHVNHKAMIQSDY